MHHLRYPIVGGSFVHHRFPKVSRGDNKEKRWFHQTKGMVFLPKLLAVKLKELLCQVEAMAN